MNVVNKIITELNKYVDDKKTYLKKIGVKRRIDVDRCDQYLVCDSMHASEVNAILCDMDFLCHYITTFERILKGNPNDGNILTVNFEQLEELSNRFLSNFNARFKLIMYMINDNLGKDILMLADFSIDVEELEKYPFKYLTAEEILKMDQNEALGEFMNSKNPSLAKAREELLDFMSKTSKKYRPIVEAHKDVKEHYLDIKSSYNDDDIDVVVGALSTIGLSDDFCYQSRELLLQKKKNTTIDTISSTTSIVKKTESKTITKKEYYKLKEEINSYFDLDEMEAIRPLYIEERANLIYLLEKYGMKKDDIIRILKIVEKENIWRNPISVLNDIYEKLKYYNDGSLTESLEILKLCISEVCLMQESDRYENTIEFARECLDSILSEVPKTYEYEFKMAHEIKG